MTGRRRAADVTHVAVGSKHTGVNRNLGGGAAQTRRRVGDCRRGRDGVERIRSEENECKAGRRYRDRTRVGGLVAGDGRHSECAV